jgi:hypothetical protein
VSATIAPKKALGAVKPPPVPVTGPGLKKTQSGGALQDKPGIPAAKKATAAGAPKAAAAVEEGWFAVQRCLVNTCWYQIRYVMLKRVWLVC